MFIFCPSFDYINQPECLQKRHFALHDEKSVTKKCALNIVSVQPIVLDLILGFCGIQNAVMDMTS